MGTRRQLFYCRDCEEEERESDEEIPIGGDRKSEFWVRMESMERERLIEHIENIECPECGSKDWFMSDTSQI